MGHSYNILQGILQVMFYIFHLLVQILIYIIGMPIAMAFIFGLVIQKACANMNFVIGDFIAFIMAMIIWAIPIALVILLFKKRIQGKVKYVAIVIIIVMILGIVLLMRHYVPLLLEDIIHYSDFLM